MNVLNKSSLIYILALQDYRAKLDVLREDNENLLKRVSNKKNEFLNKLIDLE